MLLQEALKLRRDWAMKGNPPCTHPILDEEYYWGECTGGYLCIACGKSFTHDEWEQEVKKREDVLEPKRDSSVIKQPGRYKKSIKYFLSQCEKLYAFLSRKVVNRTLWCLIRLKTVSKSH